VEVESATSSDAEESDLGMSPSKLGKKKAGKKKGKGKGKEGKGKKPDGWLWMESLTRGQAQSDEKLAEYKKESKWRFIYIECRLFTDML
jgi:hypothetical protein